MFSVQLKDNKSIGLTLIPLILTNHGLKNQKLFLKTQTLLPQLLIIRVNLLDIAADIIGTNPLLPVILLTNKLLREILLTVELPGLMDLC